MHDDNRSHGPHVDGPSDEDDMVAAALAILPAEGAPAFANGPRGLGCDAVLRNPQRTVVLLHLLVAPQARTGKLPLLLATMPQPCLQLLHSHALGLAVSTGFQHLDEALGTAPPLGRHAVQDVVGDVVATGFRTLA